MIHTRLGITMDILQQSTNANTGKCEVSAMLSMGLKLTTQTQCRGVFRGGRPLPPNRPSPEKFCSV